jgi:two-component system phosphate regulon sensor histidine kinase PhoR
MSKPEKGTTFSFKLEKAFISLVTENGPQEPTSQLNPNTFLTQ